jgi:hypothetical protein
MEFLSGTPDNIWVPLDVEHNMRDAALRPMGEGRDSPEWDMGMSTIIHAAKVAAGENVGDIEGDQPGVRVQEGFLFETVVEYAIAGAPFDEAVELAFKRYCLSLRKSVVTQVRYIKDRIRLTPDALDSFEQQHESYKSTRRSLRNARSAADFESNFWTWCMQEMAYCLAGGLNQVRWIVWWQAGDYSRGKGTGPCVLEATARFEQEELERNWQGVTAIAERIRKERMVA